MGNFVFYDWDNNGTYDHEAIITSTNGQVVDAHTNNCYHVHGTLAQYNASWQTARISIYHMPDTAS